MLAGLLAFAGAVFVIVLIHEAGHWLAARWAGMPSSVFSVGFGRRLVGFRKWGTDFRISLIPLGGYVRVDPMEEIVEGPAGGTTRFDAWPMGQRVVVVVAGVVMNLLLALAIYLAVPLAWGVEREMAGPGARVADVRAEALPAGTEAWDALPAGARVMAVGDRPVERWQDLLMALVGTAHGAAELRLDDGSVHVLPVPTVDGKRVALLEALVRQRGERVRVGPLEAAAVAGESFRASLDLIRESWAIILTGRVSARQLSGPVAIAGTSARIFTSGWESFLLFVAFLSVNIAVVNILPIPALDGGYLALMGVEAVRRRPLSARVQSYLGRVGIIWLSLVMASTVVNDLLRMAGQ